MNRVRIIWLILAFWSVHALAEPDIQGDAPVPVSSFQELDAEVEQILNEVVSFGAEMAVLEESRELSEQHQLLVVVSMDPSPFFRLEALQLSIDGRPVNYHQYNDKELDALSKGGSHRLFWDDVIAGRHQLSVDLFGRVPNDPDFQRQATQMVFTGMGRRVLELRVASGKNQTFPELSLREWK